jgi:hypothetical protein
MSASSAFLKNTDSALLIGDGNSPHGVDRYGEGVTIKGGGRPRTIIITGGTKREQTLTSPASPVQPALGALPLPRTRTTHRPRRHRHRRPGVMDRRSLSSARCRQPGHLVNVPLFPAPRVNPETGPMTPLSYITGLDIFLIS